jgi:hypothetical protein
VTAVTVSGADQIDHESDKSKYRSRFQAVPETIEGGLGGAIMTRRIWTRLILGALIFSITLIPLNTVAATSKIERAVVSLDEPVRLLSVVLQPGRYLFLHHDGMMERGRPCMYIYTLDSPNEGVRVVEFHCTAVARSRAVEFRLVIRKVPNDLPQAIEVQFAGTAEGHLVPEHQDAHP